MKKYNKFTQTLLWLLVACLSVFTGCVEDEDLTASFGTTILKYDAAAQNIPYTITSNGEWTISSNKDWCTPSVSEGNGTTGIDIVLTYNGTSVERTAILSLTCNGTTNTLTIVQSAQLCSLEVSPLSLAAGVDEESFDLAITSNTSWTASTEDAWIDLKGVVSRTTSLSYSGNAFMNISVEENDTFKDRVGTITISAQSNDGSQTLTKTVVVSQSANSTAAIILSTKSVNFTSAATEAKSVVFYGTTESDLTATTDATWCTVAVTGSTITITPTANSSSSASRFAIVTVTATVSGVETTEQITVSQDGSTEPEIYLYNSAYNVSATSTSVTLNWLNLNSTSISIESTESWATLSDKTTTSVKVSYAANTEVYSRSAIIRISYTDLLGNICYKEILLTQAGVGAPNIYYNDLSLSATNDTGTMYIVVDNKNATLGTVFAANSWLTISSQDTSTTDGSFAISYTYSDNYSDSSRENVITIPVEIGSTTYVCNVNVSQNGLGAPDISTLTNVYVSAEANTYSQSMWITGGDSESVSYTVYYTYSENLTTGVSSDEKWVSSAEVVNNSLEVTVLDNKLNDSRSAVITIVAARGASTSTIDVMLTQAGTASPGIVGLSQELYYDYNAAPAETKTFEYINSSSASVATYTAAAMISSPTVTSAPALTYSISEYTGGETGSYRQGIITLKVTNFNEYPVYYDVLITQTAPENPSIDAPDTIYIPYTTTTNTIPINLLNSAEIVDTTAATIIYGSTDSDWLSITLTDSSISYTADAYAGKDGDSRSAVVSFYVSNTSSNKSMCTIEFVQGESDAATASVPELVTVGFEAGTYSFDVTLSGADGATVAGAAYGVDNIGLFDTAPTYSDKSVGFTVTKNTTTSQRSGYVIVTVTGANSYDKSIYYVPVTQLTADEVVITAPTSTLSYGNETGTYKFPISTTYSGTLEAESSATWLGVNTTTGLSTEVSITLDAYTGNEDYREAFITLSVENANSSEKDVVVTVRQYKDGSAFVSAPSAISVGSAAFSVSVPYSVNEDATSTSISYADNATTSWLSASGDTTPVTISAAANTAAESREGYVAITVKNNSNEEYTHYITVTQAGTEDATASVPSTVNVGYIGDAISIATSNIDNVSSVELAEVSDVDDMITLDATTSLSAVTFDVEKNTSLEARYALLSLTVTGVNNNVAIYYITVNQAGVPDITLAVPSTVYLGTAEVLTAIVAPVEYTNATTVAAESSEAWLNVAADATSGVSITTDDANTSADSREAYITVTAENAAGESISEVIVVTQAGTADASVSVPTTVNVAAEAISVSLPASITDGIVDSYEVESDATPIISNYEATTSAITFDVAENTSTLARYALLSVTVEGTNGNTSIYYINVNQAGAKALVAPTLEVPSAISVGATGASFEIPAKTDASQIGVSFSGDISYTDDGEPVYLSSYSGVITFTTKNNTTASELVGYITVTATSEGLTTTKIITVTQAAASSTVVSTSLASVASEVTVSNDNLTGVSLDVTLSSDVDTAVTPVAAVVYDTYGMVSNVAYATNAITFDVAENKAGQDISATLSLTVTGIDGTESVSYIVVNQTNVSTTASFGSDLGTSYNAISVTSSTDSSAPTSITNVAAVFGIGFGDLVNSAYIETVEVSTDGDLFDAAGVTYTITGTRLAVDAPTFANEGAARTGSVTVTITSYNGNTDTMTLYVEQEKGADVAFAAGTSTTQTHTYSSNSGWSGLIGTFVLEDANALASYDVEATTNPDGMIYSLGYNSTTGYVTALTYSNATGAERTAVVTLTITGKTGNVITATVTVIQPA